MIQIGLIPMLLCGLVVGVHAQTLKEIQTSEAYICGVGEGSNLKQADRLAIDDLISQISVQVESKFVNMVSEEDGDVSKYAKLVLSTYSNTTLNQARRKVIEKRGKVTVVRYLAKTDLDQLFRDRERKIIDYTRSALCAEEELRIADALKYYTWALVLLRSHPDYNRIAFEFPEQGRRLLLTTLPDRINRVFSLLRISVREVTLSSDQQKKTAILDISWQDQPVQNLDYIYWVGDTWTGLMSAKDGLGVAEFFGEAGRSLDKLRVRVEYSYENKSKVDLELKQVLEDTDTPFFAQAEFEIPMVPNGTAQTDAAPIVPLSDPRAKACEDMVRSVVQAIAQKDFSDIRSCFTPDGYEMFQRLIRYGKAAVIGGHLALQTAELEDGVMVRSVPMTFSFPNNDRTFVEKVVFIFDKDRKIDALCFALSDRAIGDILGKSDRFGSSKHKYQLIESMEHYKTAYCLERIDYIESIFAENALIIVGHVLKEAEPIDGMYQVLGDKVRYVRLAKQEYIANLKRVFARNEFVNIHFEENTVKKIGGEDNIYGIQIAQHYYSENYADKGYLFLMLDLNKPSQPKIYVRSWQMERSPDGSVMGLSDFHF
ncbi:MAG: hypothetical protein V1800_17495 [Candidatus Latescibacterota bacterium]